MECFRRLLLASVIGIASEDSALASVLGFLLCLGFHRIFSKRPFKEEDDSTFGIVLTYALAFMFLGALLIKVNAQPSGELERRIFEIILVFLLLMGPGIIITNALRSIFKKRLECCKERTMTSRKLSGPTKRTGILRPGRQVSLVRSPDSKAMVRIPCSGVNSNAETVYGGPIASISEGMQPDLITPTTTVEDGTELKEIKEELSKITVAEEKSKLSEIQGDLTTLKYSKIIRWCCLKEKIISV